MRAFQELDCRVVSFERILDRTNTLQLQIVFFRFMNAVFSERHNECLLPRIAKMTVVHFAYFAFNKR